MDLGPQWKIRERPIEVATELEAQCRPYGSRSTGHGFQNGHSDIFRDTRLDSFVRRTFRRAMLSMHDFVLCCDGTLSDRPFPTLKARAPCRKFESSLSSVQAYLNPGFTRPLFLWTSAEAGTKKSQYQILLSSSAWCPAAILINLE